MSFLDWVCVISLEGEAEDESLRLNIKVWHVANDRNLGDGESDSDAISEVLEEAP